MKDSDFFQRLYRGFEAEHLVAGKLFGDGLEALKLPGDFGFDLLVSNQLQKATAKPAAAHRVRDFPYVLQVKSRTVQANWLQIKNGRQECFVNFWITEHEYLQLSKEDSAYLVLVAFLPSELRVLSTRHMILWFKGSQLPALRDATFLKPIINDGKRYYDLSVLIRLIRKSKTEDLLQGLVAKDMISSEACKTLLKELPEEYVPDTSGEYVSLMRRDFRQDHATDTDRPKACSVIECHTDILKIGAEVSGCGVSERSLRPEWIPLQDFEQGPSI